MPQRAYGKLAEKAPCDMLIAWPYQYYTDFRRILLR